MQPRALRDPLTRNTAALGRRCFDHALWKKKQRLGEAPDQHSLGGEAVSEEAQGGVAAASRGLSWRWRVRPQRGACGA